ncbi:MAG: hypothetical protein Q8O57_07720 [Kiritimatiellota bacterium]|nr:hypothetical protein [Kiritimatiellota bacterium]
MKIRLPVLPENFRPAYLALVGCMLTLANSHVIIFTLVAMDRITVSESAWRLKRRRCWYTCWQVCCRPGCF